jgi:hypothetical protein
LRTAFLPLLAVLAGLAACSRPSPPVGKWEGGYDANGTIVAARVEIGPEGRVRVSAPDLTNVGGTTVQHAAIRARLAAELADGWDNVAPRDFQFDGTTFRKPGGYAPQMVWDKASGQMTLQLYIGANPAIGVTLRPVDGFHDNPFAAV